MTTQSVKPPHDGGAANVHSTAKDDSSDVTPPAKRPAIPNDAEIIERTVKFRFPGYKHGHSVLPANVHLHWLQLIQDTYGKQVEILNNHGRVLPKVDTVCWTTTQHEQHFNVHYAMNNNRNLSNSKPTTVFIIHRIRTTMSLFDLKTPQVIALLDKNKCYLTAHRWSEDVWNTTQLGFMIGFDPAFYSNDQAKTKLRDELAKLLPRGAKIPKFQMANASPMTTFNNKTARSKAYAIEVEKASAIEMSKIMKTAYKENHEFVPFPMRYKYPEAYYNHIRQQTFLMSTYATVIIDKVGNDVIHYISEHILAIKGVKDMIPSNKVEQDGRFRIHVDRSEFHNVRSFLKDQLPKWYDTIVAEDAKAIAMRKYGHPEIPDITGDGYSSGEGTYMSTSASTAMSYKTTLSDLTLYSKDTTVKSRDNNHQKSWADRVSDQNPLSSTPAANATILAELTSSKAAVQKLMKKITQLEEARSAERLEKERKHEQERKDAEIEKDRERREWEKEREKEKREWEELRRRERKEFEDQRTRERKDLDEQRERERREVHEQRERDRQAMEHQVQNQIAAAVQAQLNQFTASQDTNRNAMSTYMQTQDARFAEMSNMFMQFMTTQQQHQQPAGIKRPATIDLTEAQSPEKNNMGHYTSEAKQREDRKRQNLQVTPQKLSFQEQPRDRGYPRDIGHSTVHESPVSTTTETPTTGHSHSYNRSWDSPNSNLAMHKDYASPGNPPSESIPPGAFESPSSDNRHFYEDSDMSDVHIEDIQQQHAKYRPSQALSGDGKVTALTEKSKVPQSPNEDSAFNQARPVDDASDTHNHDE